MIKCPNSHVPKTINAQSLGELNGSATDGFIYKVIKAVDKAKIQVGAEICSLINLFLYSTF